MNLPLFLTPILQTPKIYQKIEHFLTPKEKKQLEILTRQTFDQFIYLLDACLIQKGQIAKKLFTLQERQGRVVQFMGNRCETNPLTYAKNLSLILNRLSASPLKDIYILNLLKENNLDQTEFFSYSPETLLSMLQPSSYKLAQKIFQEETYFETKSFQPLFQKIFAEQEELLAITWIEIVIRKMLRYQPYRERPIVYFWHDLFTVIATSTSNRQNIASMITFIPLFISSLNLLDQQLTPVQFSTHYWPAYKQLIILLLSSAKKSCILCDQHLIDPEKFLYLRDRFSYLWTHIQEKTGGYRQVIEILGDIESLVVYKITSQFLMKLLWQLEELSWLAQAIRGTKQNQFETITNIEFICKEISHSAQSPEILLEKTKQIIEKTTKNDPIFIRQFLFILKKYINFP